MDQLSVGSWREVVVINNAKSLLSRPYNSGAMNSAR